MSKPESDTELSGMTGAAGLLPLGCYSHILEHTGQSPGKDLPV